jgi:Fe2+ transport system protein B
MKEERVPFRETVMDWIAFLAFGALVTAVVCACIAIVTESDAFSWISFVIAYPLVLGLIYGLAFIGCASSRYE